MFKIKPREKKKYRLGGQEVDEDYLKEKYGANDKTDTTYRNQPDQLYSQALESSEHPEDVELRQKLRDADPELQASKREGEKYLKAQSLKKDAFIKSLKKQDFAPKEKISVAESTGVNKPMVMLKKKGERELFRLTKK